MTESVDNETIDKYGCYFFLQLVHRMITTDTVAKRQCQKNLGYVKRIKNCFDIGTKYLVVPVFPRSYASKKFEFPKVTMNDLPSPEGDWFTMNNARQRSYNLQFVAGVGSLIISLAFGFATNMFECFGDIPEEPLEIDCYK